MKTSIAIRAVARPLSTETDAKHSHMDVSTKETRTSPSRNVVNVTLACATETIAIRESMRFGDKTRGPGAVDAHEVVADGKAMITCNAINVKVFLASESSIAPVLTIKTRSFTRRLTGRGKKEN